MTPTQEDQRTEKSNKIQYLRNSLSQNAEKISFSRSLYLKKSNGQDRILGEQNKESPGKIQGVKHVVAPYNYGYHIATFRGTWLWQGKS